MSLLLLLVIINNGFIPPSCRMNAFVPKTAAGSRRENFQTTVQLGLNRTVPVRSALDREPYSLDRSWDLQHWTEAGPYAIVSGLWLDRELCIGLGPWTV
jgi:hypothetical protein